MKKATVPQTEKSSLEGKLEMQKVTGSPNRKIRLGRKIKNEEGNRFPKRKIKLGRKWKRKEECNLKKQWIRLGAVLFLAGMLNGCGAFQKNQESLPEPAVELLPELKEEVYEDLNDQWRVLVTADYDNYSKFEIKFENKETREVQNYEIVGMDYKFLWNEDSTMVAVSYATRRSNEYDVVNLKEKRLEDKYSIFLDADFQEQFVHLDTNQILSETPVLWEGKKLRTEFSYTELDRVEYHGSYQYDFEEKKLEYSYFDGPVSLEKELEKIPEQLAKIKLKDLTATKIADTEALEKDNILLLAELKDYDMALYGLNNGWYKGVILRTGDQIQTFDWSYTTPLFQLPKMVFRDYDQDGKKELAVSLLNSSGTGFSVSELHVLEQQADFSYIDHLFDRKDYMEQLEKQLPYRYEEEKKLLTLFAGEEKREKKVDLTELLSDYTFQGLNYGDMISYTLKDSIQMKINLGCVVQETAMPVYGEKEWLLEAEVEYKERAFTIKELRAV